MITRQKQRCFVLSVLYIFNLGLIYIKNHNQGMLFANVFGNFRTIYRTYFYQKALDFYRTI